MEDARWTHATITRLEGEWNSRSCVNFPETSGRPWVFFGGVMLMGVFSTIGLALYGRYVAAPAETAGD